MSWRTVIISSQAKLDYKMGYLVVRGEQKHRILIDEIGVLLIENPMVSLTGCLIEVLTEKKIKVIFCDSKRNPVSELVPHHGSHDSSVKIRTQFGWKKEIKDIVWREIVIEKIRKQESLLRERKKIVEAELLQSYVGQVLDGDSSNREGHAAKVYFNALFGKEFMRSSDIPINAALNYGYSMILSVVNREISANGYLTQLGIFHSNMFNHFNLGSDLMEPFRVLVDRKVLSMQLNGFGKDEKHAMWDLLEQIVMIDNMNQSVVNALRIYTRSVFDAINDCDVSKIKFYY